MSNKPEADRIIRSHTLWSMGAGLIPLPLFDVAAVTAIQIDMLQQLARLYSVDYTRSNGKTFVAALTGGTFARIAASLLKTIPGIGTALGGVSMAAMSGASTWAVGQVVVRHLERGGDFLNVDSAWARRAYDEAFEQGKDVVRDLKKDEDASRSAFEKLEQLGKLRDQGVITEQEFAEQKAKLLERLTGT